MGKAGLAFEKELAERIRRYAQTHCAAFLLVGGFGDTSVRVAPRVVQSHRLSDSRDAGTLGFSSREALRFGVFSSSVISSAIQTGLSSKSPCVTNLVAKIPPQGELEYPPSSHRTHIGFS